MDILIGDIKIGRRLDGTEISIKKIVVGEGDPKLFLGASIHGDELTPLAVLWRLTEYFRVSRLKGTLTMLAGMNPEGLSHISRLEPFYKVDLNRVYPGDVEGVLPYKIAYSIYREAIDHDVAVDIHTAGECIPFILLDPVEGDLKRNVIDLALSTGITVLEEYPKEKYESIGLHGSLPPHLLRNGIPSFTLELSGGGKIDWKGVNVGFKAVLNLMIRLEMIDAKPNVIEEVFVIKEYGFRRHDIRSEKSGIVENFVELGEYVDRHMPLGIIRDLIGNPIEWVRADRSGYIISLPYKSVLYPHDRAYLLAVKD